MATALTLPRAEDVAAVPPRPSFLSPRGAACAGTDERANQSDFIQKARAPMASAEFERILSAEREHWLGNCLREVRAIVEKGTEEAAEERVAAAAEAQALRASLCEQAKRLAAAGAAGTEASVAALGEALRADSARTAEAIARLRGEVAQAQSRAAEGQAPVAGQPEVAELRAEARASRAEIAELQAEVARLRPPPGSDAGEAIQELRASVAQLQSSAPGQEPLRRLAELTGELSAGLEQAQASAELAHRRISELGSAAAAAAEARSLQDDDAAAEAPGGLDLTLPCAVLGDAGPPGQPCCGREAVADARAALEQLTSRSLELEARGEATARQTAADMLELASGLEGLSAAQGEVERRLGELAEADAARGPGGDAEAQIGSLRRLLQDQGRELAVLSSELGSVRERCAASSGRDAQWGAVWERVAELESTMASTRAEPEQQEQQLDELAETLPARPEPPAPHQRPAAERLLTLLGRASPAPLARGLSPKGGRRPAPEHGARKAEPACVSDRLKDSLEGVVNAVQRVLEEEEHQQKHFEPVPAPAGQAAARAPQVARHGLPVQAPAAWRAHSVVAARAASPMVRVATVVPAVHPPRRAPVGSVLVSPGTPLLIRR